MRTLLCPFWRQHRKTPIFQANILVKDDGSACLADFGLTLVSESISATTGTTTSTSLKGTLHWLAPEVLENIPREHQDFHKRDVYAFGCTVLEVFVLTSFPYSDHSYRSHRSILENHHMLGYRMHWWCKRYSLNASILNFPRMLV
jgi:serine/threonine protein kinase